MVRKLEIQGGGNKAGTIILPIGQSLNVPSPFSTPTEAATLGI
jgi:hypothetical protein